MLSGTAEPTGLTVVRAPGRVNLMGEHTDYNHGLVLPVAIDLELRIARRPRDDRRVRIALVATGETAELDLDRIGPAGGGWIDYVAGTAREMAASGLATFGFDGVLASTIPIASGLSSSAALELATAWALAGPTAADRSTRSRLAQVARRAENGYVGVQSGLMDQFASACGIAGSALFLDCRTLDHRAVPIPADLRLVVCHSGVTHRHEAGEYNTRRAECERAVAALSALEGRPLRALRDVDADMLPATGRASTRSSAAGPNTSSARTPGSWRPRPPCAPTTSPPSAACSPRATPRCATCSRSRRRRSTHSSRSRSPSPASLPPG